MGTSTTCPGSPKWGSVKGACTVAAGGGPVSQEKAAQIVADFVQGLCDGKDDGIGKLPSKFASDSEKAKKALKQLVQAYPVSPAKPASAAKPGPSSSSGGSSSGRGSAAKPTTTRGRKSGGSGGSSSGNVRSIKSRGVRPTAQRIATFLSNVSKQGIRESLRALGISDSDQNNPESVALALTDILCGPNSLFVDAELRDATAALLEDLCPDTLSLETIEISLTEAAYDLEGVLSRLFENYIMERFKTTLSEHLSKQFDFNAADKIANEAKEFVATEMQLLRSDRVDLTEVDWTGNEGNQILNGILETTIAVYLT